MLERPDHNRVVGIAEQMRDSDSFVVVLRVKAQKLCVGAVCEEPVQRTLHVDARGNWERSTGRYQGMRLLRTEMTSQSCFGKETG